MLKIRGPRYVYVYVVVIQKKNLVESVTIEEEQEKREKEF